jgi:hypothetical protein
MPVDPQWIETAVRAVKVLEAIYGPNDSVERSPDDCVEVLFEDGGYVMLTLTPEGNEGRGYANALRSALTTPQEKPETHDITYLMNAAWNCGCRWGREAGGGNTSGQDEQRVADVKRLLALENCHGEPSPTEVEDRRCGTCANNDPDVTVCGWMMRCRAGIQVPFSVYQADDGPPWPNCRFWKERS